MIRMGGGRGTIGHMGAALLLAAMASPAGTALPSLAEEQRALVRARQQAQEARLRSEALEQRADKAAADADRARDRAAAVAARIQQAEADLRAGEARIAILDRMSREQAARLAARQEPVMRLTAGLQTMANRPPVLALLQPGTVSDTVHLRMVLADIIPVIAARTRGLRAEIARLQALRADAQLARTALTRSRETLSARRAELARIEAEKRIASRGLRDSAAQETERALAMAEDARDIADLMKQIEDAGTVRAALAALPGPVLRPARPGDAALPGEASRAAEAATPPYRLPVIGDVVTGFGEVSQSGVRARGLTIATSPGATVVAPADGRVAFAGPFRDYGQIVIIDHGSGWTSLITAMRRLSVRVGDTLRQGDPVGIAATERPRITVELRRQDRAVDIAALLR